MRDSIRAIGLVALILAAMFVAGWTETMGVW